MADARAGAIVQRQPEDWNTTTVGTEYWIPGSPRAGGRGLTCYGAAMTLRDSTVLVTGGSAGIGFAIAEMLAQAGARVAITGRRADRLKAAANRIGALPIQADVSLEADAVRTIRETLAAFGHLDALINNAGLGSFKKLVDQDRASFDAVMAVNVTGAMLMAREAARHFVERKRGTMVNIGSTASHRGAPNGTAYYASKFALRGMTECWRAELRAFNVRVTLVNPSEVITDFAESAGLGRQNPGNATKLRGVDIAHAVRAALELDDRGFVTEMTVFATNPKD